MRQDRGRVRLVLRVSVLTCPFPAFSRSYYPAHPSRLRRLGRLRSWIVICEKLGRPCGGMFELGVERLGFNMTFDTVRDNTMSWEKLEGSGISTIPQPEKEGELPNKHSENVPAKVPANV